MRREVVLLVCREESLGVASIVLVEVSPTPNSLRIRRARWGQLCSRQSPRATLASRADEGRLPAARSR